MHRLNSIRAILIFLILFVVEAVAILSSERGFCFFFIRQITHNEEWLLLGHKYVATFVSEGLEGVLWGKRYVEQFGLPFNLPALIVLVVVLGSFGLRPD